MKQAGDTLWKCMTQWLLNDFNGKHEIREYQVYMKWYTFSVYKTNGGIRKEEGEDVFLLAEINLWMLTIDVLSKENKFVNYWKQITFGESVWRYYITDNIPSTWSSINNI